VLRLEDDRLPGSRDLIPHLTILGVYRDKQNLVQAGAHLLGFLHVAIIGGGTKGKRLEAVLFGIVRKKLRVKKHNKPVIIGEYQIMS
jgi:hypothetical protein